MKVIKVLLILAVIYCIGLMIRQGIKICNGQVPYSDGFVNLSLQGLAAIVIQEKIKALKVREHHKGR